MSTITLYDLPSTEDAAKVAKERKTEAKKHFDALKKAGELESTTSLTIGWHAHYLKREGLFGILGFEDEDAARKASGVGRSTWYSVIRLAEAFNGLEKEQFVSMKHSNAQALSDLPESSRLSREWIRMAGSMSIEDFQAKVDVELDGRAKASNGKEKGTVLKMPMPLTRKKVVEAGLLEYANKVGVENGDTGKALELLVVEKKGETSLIEAITNAVQRVKDAKKLRESNLSAEELVEKLYGIMDDMVIEFSASLTAVQNSDEPVPF